MQMPQPTEQHRVLERLTGKWKGSETMEPSPWDPQGGTATGIIDARADLEGMFVVSDYRQERDGKVTYRGHGVYGYDPSREAYTMYWFDSMSHDPGGVALGRLEGDTLTFQMQNKMGGHSRYVTRFLSDREHEFRIEMSQDGQTFQTWMHATYERA